MENKIEILTDKDAMCKMKYKNKKINIIVLDKTIFDISHYRCNDHYDFEIDIEKSILGIINLLCKKYKGTSFYIYVLDRVRIHPSFILKYIETLKKDIIEDNFENNIILTTDVDMLKCLDYCFVEKESELFKKSNEIKFYLAKKIDGKFELEDCTDKIDVLYKSLCDDMHKLFFKSMEESIFEGVK